MKSSIGIYYQITVKDKTGKVIKKTRVRRSKSCVLQFLKLLSAQMMQAVTSIKDVTNTAKNVSEYASNFATDGAIGSVDKGIVIGTGTTAPDNTDVALETKIAHGSGATQINYAANSYVGAQVVGANVDFQTVRSMQNLSGSPINVTEAGIQALMYSAGNFYALIVHDVFTAVPVADGQTITVTYTIRTTV